MGLKLSLLIADTKEKLTFTTYPPIENSQRVKTENLCPKSLHVGFYQNKVIILNEGLLEHLFNQEEELHKIETDLFDRFPNAEILHFQQFDTISFVGFIVLRNHKKIRCKAVAEGRIYLDKGDLLGVEKEFSDQIQDLLKENNSKFFYAFEEKIKNYNENERIRSYLILRERVFKDKYGYKNGGIDEHIVHSLIEYFIENDWTGLCQIDFIKYPKVQIGKSKIDIIHYVNDAFLKLCE